jgi:hypothetical protein
MKNINWNIVGDNKVCVKFTIPIKARKKWWQFWKKDEAKQILKINSTKQNNSKQ